jgi:hypothetical protein
VIGFREYNIIIIIIIKMIENENKYGICEFHPGEREVSYCDPKMHPNCPSNGEMLCEVCCNEGKYHTHFGFLDII